MVYSACMARMWSANKHDSLGCLRLFSLAAEALDFGNETTDLFKWYSLLADLEKSFLLELERLWRIFTEAETDKHQEQSSAHSRLDFGVSGVIWFTSLAIS